MSVRIVVIVTKTLITAAIYTSPAVNAMFAKFGRILQITVFLYSTV